MASTDRRPEGKKVTPWSTDGTLHQWRCNDCGAYAAQAGALQPGMMMMLAAGHKGHDVEVLEPTRRRLYRAGSILGDLEATVLQGSTPKRKRNQSGS